jgi:hypothetical protein
MQTNTRFDLFEPGDRTALICVDDPELHNIAVAQVAALGYKMHTGLFAEDIALKLKSQTYDLVVVYEHFSDSDVDTNPVLAELNGSSAAQRRAQFVALIGAGMVTDDEMQAFQLSVDLVAGIAEGEKLAVLIERAAARRDQFYRAFKECHAMASVM